MNKFKIEQGFISLVLPPVHRTGDPITSVLAETAITESGARGSIMRQVLWYVQDHPGQCAGEISEGLGFTSWQVSKRLSDLKNKGLIHPSGVKLFKERKQQTWREIQYTLP